MIQAEPYKAKKSQAGPTRIKRQGQIDLNRVKQSSTGPGRTSRLNQSQRMGLTTRPDIWAKQNHTGATRLKTTRLKQTGLNGARRAKWG